MLCVLGTEDFESSRENIDRIKWADRFPNSKPPDSEFGPS